LRAGSAEERGQHLRRAAQGRNALLDLIVDTQGLPSELLPAACQALLALGPKVEEAALLQAARHLLLDTPGPILTRLGELARQARGESSSLAEQTLLGLLQRARCRAEVDWDCVLPLVRALARGGGGASIRPLAALLGAADPLARDALAVGEALAAIASRGHARRVVGQLVIRLDKSQSEAERYFGHVTLGRIASRYAGPYLERRIAEGVRQRGERSGLAPSLAAAIHALGRVDAPESVRFLLSLEARVARGDLVLREAIVSALGQARRVAPDLGLIPLLVDWLGAAEDKREPGWLIRALGEALASLTGHSAPAQHKAWFAYLATHGTLVQGQPSPAVPQAPARAGRVQVEGSPSRRILRPQLVYPDGRQRSAVA
jgi:hypothetical protein